MCTVVVRWSPGLPAQVLALRDELVSRPFDDPGAWWPALPDVVGGRDRVGGGSWCVTDVRTGRTGLVLNRPERRTAAPGAPSRGVLPLLAVEHGQDWPDHVDRTGMASFTVVLVAPDALVLWDSDGSTLSRREPGPGTHLVTSGGAEDGKAERFLQAFRDLPPERWPDLVSAQPRADDPGALLVEHRVDGPAGAQVFATVFAQRLETRPGLLTLRSTRRPEQPGWAATTVRAGA